MDAPWRVRYRTRPSSASLALCPYLFRVLTSSASERGRVIHHLKIDVVLPAFQRQQAFQPLAERADGDVINDRTGRGFGERLD